MECRDGKIGKKLETEGWIGGSWNEIHWYCCEANFIYENIDFKNL